MSEDIRDLMAMSERYDDLQAENERLAGELRRAEGKTRMADATCDVLAAELTGVEAQRDGAFDELTRVKAAAREVVRLIAAFPYHADMTETTMEQWVHAVEVLEQAVKASEEEEP